MYIVNYGDSDGWQILSSDARTPAVIAEGEDGYFSLEDGSPAVRVWMDCAAADLAAVRNASDEELNFSPEAIAANKNVWGLSGEKGFGGEDGHWETITTGELCVSDSINHMTPHWDQYAYETVNVHIEIPVKVGLFLNYLKDNKTNPDAQMLFRDEVLTCDFSMSIGLQ